MILREITDQVKIKNVAGTVINPATNEPLVSVLAQLDVALSTITSETTAQALLDATGESSGTSILDELQSILGKLDVALSTRASESTLSDVKTNLDNVKTKLDTLIATDFSTEATSAGILNTIGEETGTTVLSDLGIIYDKLAEIYNDRPTKGQQNQTDSLAITFAKDHYDETTRALSVIHHDEYQIHRGRLYYIEGHTTLGVAGILRVKLTTPNTTEWGHFVWNIGSSGILETTLDEDCVGATGGSRPTIHANNRNVDCWAGLHAGGNNEATVLTDSTKSWVVDTLIGMQVFNTTDGSSGIIIDNDATSVTVSALAGGTDNDWDTNDKYEINNSQFIITTGVTVATSYIQRIANTSFGSRSAGGSDSRIDELILKQNTDYCRTFTSGAASNIIHFKASWCEITDLSNT